MGGLLHLVQRGRTWAGCGPAQSLPRCTKCNSQPINGQCTNFILFDGALQLPVLIKGLIVAVHGCVRLIKWFVFHVARCMRQVVVDCPHRPWLTLINLAVVSSHSSGRRLNAIMCVPGSMTRIVIRSTAAWHFTVRGTPTCPLVDSDPRRKITIPDVWSWQPKCTVANEIFAHFIYCLKVFNIIV